MSDERTVCSHCGFEVVRRDDVCPLCEDDEAAGAV